MDTSSQNFTETQLGALPVEWEVASLSEFAEIKYGKANPKLKGHVPVIGSGGVFTWTRKALVEYPTIIIGRKGTAGEVHLAEIPSYPSDTTFYLAWKNEIDIYYLYYFLSLYKLSGQDAKTTLPSLQRTSLENQLIAVPPIPEQRAISRVLSTIQRAIETQDNLIAAERELKKSLMRQLFTQGLEANGAVKETEIGMMPEYWELYPIRDVVEIQYGYQTSIPKVPPKSGVEIISTAEILNEGRLSLSKIRTVEIPPNRIEKYRVHRHDVLFNWRNAQEHVGKTAIVEEEPIALTIFASFILRLRSSGKLDQRYLHYMLSHLRQIGTFFILSRRAVNQANFNANELGELQIGVPPLSEQREIARILATVDKKIQTEEKRKAALEALFKTMLQQLMTGQIRIRDIEVKTYAPLQ